MKCDELLQTLSAKLHGFLASEIENYDLLWDSYQELLRMRSGLPMLADRVLAIPGETVYWRCGDQLWSGVVFGVEADKLWVIGSDGKSPRQQLILLAEDCYSSEELAVIVTAEKQ